MTRQLCFFVLSMIPLCGLTAEPPQLAAAENLPALAETTPLQMEGDLAAQMIVGIDAFLMEGIAEELDSPPQPSVAQLQDMLGLSRDERVERPRLEFIDTVEGPRGQTDRCRVHQVRWRAFGDVYGTGLYLRPWREPVAAIIAIPDADQPAEELAGMPPWEGLPKTLPVALALAEAGCEVLIPQLISRDRNRFDLSHREYLHRSAWQLGRTLAGYEVQKVLAGADCFRERSIPLGVIGWGEGGRIALYAGAVDERFDAALVSGYFSPRDRLWEEPADRNVFGLLRDHGDAEIASLYGERPLTLEFSICPVWNHRTNAAGELDLMADVPRGTPPGKPGRLLIPTWEEFQAEANRIPEGTATRTLRTSYPFSAKAVQEFVKDLGMESDAFLYPTSLDDLWLDLTGLMGYDWLGERQEQLIHEIDRHNQWALIDSERVRAEWWQDLNTTSLETFEESVEAYRDAFREEVIGEFKNPRLPLNPRSRPFQQGEGVLSYEVVLDVFPGVFAYGILTLPEDLPMDGSDKRPVVVCQHGLEGTPFHVIGEEKHAAYLAYATRLAQEGFITFAPQNPYRYHDAFRMLQFKANSIGRTLFSVIVPQHEQITDWLAQQPWVDEDRIGFYGLSYGGKSAMRIPPLVDRYALSICSADFNDWIWKNVATDPRSERYTYVGKREYEMFEFNLGNTFNYAEMATLICPRPFMVERGHFDGVAPDERVGYEYARIRRLYSAQLSIPERTEIEWFPGPHAIHLEGTLAFLKRWLMEED